MELPTRPHTDRFTTPGRYRQLESNIRRRVEQNDIPILFIYAFDPRTRLGPFVFVDTTLIPGAPRAIGSALYAAGFRNVRLVLQQWNPNIRPSMARFDGNPPEVLMVSAMQIHSEPACRLIRDAWQLGDNRPLILAGGPKAVYEPWDFFGLSPDGREGADVVVTGEEYVLLELLDRVVEMKRPGDTMRAAFERLREGGLLKDIPGLVYRPDAPNGPPEHLINTGVQRLVEDLDELPLPLEAMGLFEPPHGRSMLSSQPIPANQVRRHARFVAMVTTHGCQFHCAYCPIPSYNQFTFRHRSPERIVEEIAGVAQLCGITGFLGTDDNFFSRRETVETTLAAMARGKVGNKPFRNAINFATEATEFDVLKNRDLLPLARDAGLRNLWLGIEDLTGCLVKKGQTVEKTKTLFKLLLKQGIAPMPMMMHHDGQPLWTWRGLYGLLNQVRFLWRAGAASCQVTLLTPWVGSQGYEQPFRDGLVLSKVGGHPIEQYQYDGNHCLATSDTHPWRRQINMLVSYAAFYNPLNLLLALPRFDKVWADRVLFQLLGMVGLAKSIYQSRGWLKRLIAGPIEKSAELPRSRFRMAAPQGVEICQTLDTAAVRA
ncbi:MAG: B12-binding domain-containing radical SAM protein [Thermoguttaceae bacterium]